MEVLKKRLEAKPEQAMVCIDREDAVLVLLAAELLCAYGTSDDQTDDRMKRILESVGR